jgi:hypothetical protein
MAAFFCFISPPALLFILFLTILPKLSAVLCFLAILPNEIWPSTFHLSAAALDTKSNNLSAACC